MEHYVLSCLVAQSCVTLCNPMDCSPPSSFIHGNSPGKNTRVGCHGLLQRIFPTWDRTQVSCLAGGFFTVWATKEALGILYITFKYNCKQLHNERRSKYMNQRMKEWKRKRQHYKQTWRLQYPILNNGENNQTKDKWRNRRLNINQLYLTDTYRTFYTTAYTFFSSTHGTFSRTDHRLNHKLNLNRFKNISKKV